MTDSKQLEISFSDISAIEKDTLIKLVNAIEDKIYDKHKVPLDREKMIEFSKSYDNSVGFALGMCLMLRLLLKSSSMPAFLTDYDVNVAILGGLQIAIEGQKLENVFKYKFTGA